MAFHVHRSERADRLVEALADVLAAPLADPMATEVVSVPSRGVERWVAQRLSTRLGTSPGGADGVCANVEFPFPGRLVNAAVAACSGFDFETDPWRPERLVWPLLEVTGACLDEPWMSALASAVTTPAVSAAPGDPAVVSGEPTRSLSGDRRFGAVRHVADLFDHYGVHRPGMLRDWAAGHDVDAHGERLRAHDLWQPELWRRLRSWLGVPSPAERLDNACRRLVEDPGQLDVPDRVSLFGLTRIPVSHVEVLKALAAGRDVHLFALHPSPALWQAIGALPVPAGPLPRSADPDAGLARHPLLASWGRDAREMQLVLAAAAPAAPAPPAAGMAAAAIDDHRPVEDPTTTLLQRIQSDIRADRTPPGASRDPGADARAPLAVDDRSVAVHDCHGRARQVEVLRDAILHLLADDPSLEPRHIIVMCPDIDTFAPLIHATFGAATDPGATPDAGTEAPGSYPGDLRVRLADRSLRQTNPVLGVVAELLDLAEARLSASQVLDLASREPVRHRFDLDDDDLARFEQWIAAAGIRWGLDAGHRAPYGLGSLEANTWRHGLDRLLLGGAMAEDGFPLVGGVLPVDDVGSGDLDLLGRLSELVERLGQALRSLTGTRGLVGWTSAIATAAETLAATTEDDDWQVNELRRLLDDVVDETAGATERSPVELTLGEVRTLLADRLRGHPTRANFRTGHLTVCTLVPMRSVPHRVVCLLGLDDGVFPRPRTSDGDDLTERAACVGDRDARSEDRQLLLDALMAATDHLVVTYSGRDERTNARRAPAVPLGELLDVIDATCRPPVGAPESRARDRVVTVHPLQPFDPRNFTPGGLGPQPLVDPASRPAAGGAQPTATSWSFDHVYLEGARALLEERAPRAPFLAGPLPPRPTAPVEIDDLIRFLRHPVQAFVRQRLGILLTDRTNDPDDALPIELDGLGRWKVGDRLLAARLAGISPATCRAAELARGELPPGPLGEAVVDGLGPLVEQLVERAAGCLAAAHQDPRGPAVGPAGDLRALQAAAVDVSVDLGGGDTVTGTVSGVLGPVNLEVTFSGVNNDKRLAAWARLLVLSAAAPATPYRAVTVGQSAGKVRVATVGPLPGDAATRAETARAHLRGLVELYRRGMTEPLPLYGNASAAYAQAVRAGRAGLAAAQKEWTTTIPEWTKGDRDPYHELVLGGVVALDDLVTTPARPDESGPGWAADEPGRFGRYARRLWDDLLDHESVTTP